jgi:hypothetical protein
LDQTQRNRVNAVKDYLPPALRDRADAFLINDKKADDLYTGDKNKDSVVACGELKSQWQYWKDARYDWDKLKEAVERIEKNVKVWKGMGVSGGGGLMIGVQGTMAGYEAEGEKGSYNVGMQTMKGGLFMEAGIAYQSAPDLVATDLKQLEGQVIESKITIFEGKMHEGLVGADMRVGQYTQSQTEQGLSIVGGSAQIGPAKFNLDVGVFSEFPYVLKWGWGFQIAASANISLFTAEATKVTSVTYQPENPLIRPVPAGP